MRVPTMASSSFDQSKRLVDMEFKPGELPPADTQPVSDAYQSSTMGNEARVGPAAWLALLSAALILVLIVGSATVTFAANALREGSIVDLTLLLALIVLVGSSLYMLVRQSRAFWKLKSAERAREMAARLSKLDSAGSGIRLMGALEALYSDNSAVLGELHAVSSALQPHHTDRDVIELLNRDVFSSMDREADQRIQRAALRASLGVSACPHPALDALVVLVISISLINDLMRIYGLRHSARGLYRVLTRVLFTASSTAVMSTVVEFAMRAAQDRIAAAVVGTAGEAFIVARRMFALGALAKREIRPLPIAE
jgi:uncharacterized membrane protein YcjF (UPF0283 family)